MTDSDDDDPVPRVVGQDEMLRILRMEQVDEQTTSVTVAPFGETLALKLQLLEDWLLSRGWPPLDGRVFVGDADGNGWASVPDDYERRLEAEDVRADVEAPGQIELGAHFIARRAPPLSDDYWAITEARAIRRVLNANDADIALAEAFRLGQLTEQANLHKRHLPAVRKKARQEIPLKESARDNPANKISHERAEIWKSAARSIAADMWGRNPNLSISALAPKVRAKLKKCDPPVGKIPGDRSIRRAIASEKPVPP